MRCEGEVAAIRALLLEEKALGQDLVRKHRAELDGLKNDIAEKVTHTAVDQITQFFLLICFANIGTGSKDRKHSSGKG